MVSRIGVGLTAAVAAALHAVKSSIRAVPAGHTFLPTAPHAYLPARKARLRCAAREYEPACRECMRRMHMYTHLHKLGACV